jgi:hypothetical protein
VRAAWWQEQRDKVVNGFLVDPQNQGRAGTMWEPSHEWRLADATPSSRGLQWFTRKPLGYSVEPQNRDRRLDVEVWPPRLVQPPGPVRPPWPVRPLGPVRPPMGRSDRPDRWRRDASKRRTRVGIARFASRLSRLQSLGIRLMKKF